jgi:hypothetical protein
MRYAEDAQGPLTVVLHDGVQVEAAFLDCGGINVADEGSRYEVHGAYPDGQFLVIPQDQIARVVTRDGEEVEFGNPYYPGHPRSRELPEEDQELVEELRHRWADEDDDSGELPHEED